MYDVFGPPRTRRVLAEHDAQVRATLGFVHGHDLDVLDVRPQVALAGVGSPLGFAAPSHPRQPGPSKQADNGATQRLLGQLAGASGR